ncbi:hypothetical protein [Fluviispira sanaruensis]|uniref:Uncharacterized protein n=1 Tax=Fluviispira sanaruensis TaxID=2493639 RepID=A0A4P2VIW1_FLUSA|nr:hypothetical protein [Fluviispira sanaruensis]BBH53093.1 hypothetical protein JCM31447_15360 [Fluviispira sanaruensis]
MGKKFVVGIEPSAHGGLALLYGKETKQELLAFSCLSTASSGTCAKSFAGVLRGFEQFAGVKPSAVIEHPTQSNARHNSGHLQQGINYGILIGVLQYFEYDFREIYPVSWTSKYFRGMDKNLKKERGILVASRLTKKENLILPRARKPHDGIADAICIAMYALQYL